VRPSAPASNSGYGGSSPSVRPQAPGGYGGIGSAPSIRPQSPGISGGGYGGGAAPSIRPSAPGGYGGAQSLDDAKSEGKCTFDAGCWDQHPQCAIAKAVMFDRTTGGSCEDCLKMCNDQQVVEQPKTSQTSIIQSSDSPWICRSFAYDHRWQICDLFAVDGQSPPHYLVRFPGRDVFTLATLYAF
jgi:hypothetical protein